MYFAHDTELALITATALVNTDVDGVDRLTDAAGLDAFLLTHPFTGIREHTVRELEAVRDLRPRLLRIWEAPDERTAVDIVNGLFREARALPQIATHDDLGWHLHLTEPQAPLAQRIGAESAMGFADLIRSGHLDRLRRCAAEDCEAVLIDLSRNRSRRYCDVGNCGNRANVAAYRARRADPGQRRDPAS